MTLRVAQFSLKIAHLSFSMVLRGPRACGVFVPDYGSWFLLKYLEQTHLTADSYRYLSGYSSEKFTCSNSRSVGIRKGTIFYEKGMKGVPFPSKMEYKRVRVSTLGRIGASPFKTLLSDPPAPFLPRLEKKNSTNIFPASTNLTLVQ